MKNVLRCAFVVVLAVLASGSSFAAFDMVLKVKDGDLVVGKTTSADDGSFSFNNVPPGEYVLVVQPSMPPNSKGKAVAAGQTNWSTPVSVVVMPQDAASSTPTGKRQHKPMTFTKEWGAASPKLTCTVDGSMVSGRVENPSTGASVK